jgi:hypothetical protein
MIPVGQKYRPAGTLDGRSILITIILGTTAAVIGAAIVWLWEWSPIPTFVVLTPAVQGIGVGGVMAAVVKRLRMRNPWLVAVGGIACGLLSAVLVHYGHYLNMVTAAADEVRSRITQDKTLPEGERKELLARLDDDPAAFINPMLVMKTGHSGFVGSLVLRNQHGVMLKDAPVTGTFLWILWGGEALLVAIMAAMLPAIYASQPFCEECGYWCEKQANLLTLPAARGVPLVEAVGQDNPSRAAELRANPPPYDQSGMVAVSLHACPGCDQSFAEVTHHVTKGKETKVMHLLRMHRVSPEMVAVIRGTHTRSQAVEDRPADELRKEVVDDDQRQEIVD